MGALSGLPALAVVVARGGRLPLGAAEAVAEAGGYALVIGDGAPEAAAEVGAAHGCWWNDTGPGLHAGGLARTLAGPLADVPLVLLPASPDGRDLAPRLAAELDRPLLAYATRITAHGSDLLRLDGRLSVPVTTSGPVVATLVPDARSVPMCADPATPAELALTPVGEGTDVEVVEVLEPDPATMDLAEAGRVLGGGAGLVPRDRGGAEHDALARMTFALLGDVAAALGASAGATRVVTDAGWLGYDRQIGTTGVTVAPQLYVALGVAGATQHVSGLGAPRHVVSVNTDGSSPMTAMADLGLVTDAQALLVELARRLEVPVPAELEALVGEGARV